MSTALYPLVPPFVAVVILIARLLIDFGYKFGLVDQPNSRSSHVGAVPRVGGISIFIPYILLGLGLYFANFDFVVNNAPYWIGLTAIVVLGTVDDRLNLSSKFKFSIQFAVATYYVLSSGNYVDNMYGLFGIGVLPSWLGITLSIITVVYLINAVNLIDVVHVASVSNEWTRPCCNTNHENTQGICNRITEDENCSNNWAQVHMLEVTISTMKEFHRHGCQNES